jgi:hypothetical protein
VTDTRPLPIAIQGTAARYRARFESAVSLFPRRIALILVGWVRLKRGLKPQRDRGIEFRLVLLDHHQIVPTIIEHLLSKLALGEQRIHGYDGPLEELVRQ